MYTLAEAGAKVVISGRNLPALTSFWLGPLHISDQGKGSGVGFGVNARPVGVYVIKGDTVAFVPAFDLSRVIMGGQIVAVVALIVLRPLFKAKLRTAERAANEAAGT